MYWYYLILEFAVNANLFNSFQSYPKKKPDLENVTAMTQTKFLGARVFLFSVVRPQVLFLLPIEAYELNFYVERRVPALSHNLSSFWGRMKHTRPQKRSEVDRANQVSTDMLFPGYKPTASRSKVSCYR